VNGRRFAFNLLVSFEPNGKRAGEEGAPLLSEDEDAAAAILSIALDFEQAPALEGFEGGCESGAIHREQGSDGCHRRGLGAIERHEQRKLSIGEFKGTQFFVEAAAEGPGSALHMKAKTTVFDHQGFDEWQRVCT